MIVLRESIKNLIEKTFILEYTLPNGLIDKTSLTTLKDYCFRANDYGVSESIYNSIVDYCLNDIEIDITKLEIVQQKAIRDRLRFSKDADLEIQLRYGFFGEVLLNILLKVFFGTNKIIAKGHFYDPTADQEPKGYDSFHFIKKTNNIELWFGESKMYGNVSGAVNSVLQNINKVLSKEYYERNIRAVFDKSPLFDKAHTKDVFNELIDLISNGPFDKSILKELNKRRIKIFYPILIVYNEKSLTYDDKIIKVIDEIKKQISNIEVINKIDAELLFLFVPVDNVIDIKKEVIKWILNQKPII